MHLILHGELSLSLSGSSELGCVSEHGSQGYICIQDEQTSLGLSVGDSAAATHQLTHDRRLALGRNSNLDIHNRLQNLRASLLEGISE